MNIFKFILFATLLSFSVSALEDNSLSADFYIKKANLYFSEASKKNSLQDLKKSYDTLLEASKKYPDNTVIKMLMYDRGLIYIKLKYNQEIANNLKKLYPLALTLNPLGAAPPSFIDSFKYLKNPKKRAALLKKGLQENRYFIDGYFYLSEIYKQQKQYDMAAAILKMALKYEKDNKNKYLIHKTISSIYLEKFFNDPEQCLSTNKEFLKKIIKELKSRVKLNPKDSDSYKMLSSFYNYLGQNQLAIFNAKKALELEPLSKDTITGYGYTLIMSQKVDKFFKIAKSQSSDNLTFAYFAIQDWKNAKKYAKLSLKDNPKYFYSHLKFALSSAMVDGKEALKKYLLNLPKDVEVNSWEQSLIDFFTDKISKDELLKRAKNKCQKTEALFYIGFNYLIDGNKEMAKEYFKKVVDLKVYSFVEYTLSKYYLKLLKN